MKPVAVFQTKKALWARLYCLKSYQISSACLALALSACSLAPPASTPAVPVPAAWKAQPQAPAGWVSADAAQAWAQGQWWRLWDDPTLHALMARANAHNPTLQAAAASVRQAEALLAQQQAARWPTLGLGGNQQRAGGDARATGGSGALNLTASWAPDLWGRVADSARAQGANVQASRADLAAARLSVQASLALAYFALRTADAEIALLDGIIDAYARSAAITRHRYDAGVAARTDTLQAQSTLDNARASREALARSRALGEHAVALLVGEPPAAFGLPAVPDWQAAMPAVPAGVPAALLLRRPDVAAAERAVAAANARIGVARAAWFPNLTLSAAAGAGGAHLLDVIAAPQLAWSLGLSLAQTLFDAGARQAAEEQALAAHAQATALYRQRALAAMKEVEDQLATQHSLARQISHARANADTAARIERQMLNRYQAGLSAYTEVVTAQASALGARRALMQLALQQQQAAVALAQALGGGWQAPWADGDTDAAHAAPPAPDAPSASDPGR